MHYFLNIGSNLGNTKLNISRALRALEEKFGYFETSKIMEANPGGFVSPHTFANLAVMIVTDRTPQEGLADIKEIESRLNPTPHRTPEGAYADRILDIDIMAADDAIIESEELTIPHRHLAERRFFLEPLDELAPLWRHPVTGQTCTEMFAGLIDEKEEKDIEKS